MKLKLKAVNHGKDKNRYCGPSVISAVTDLTTGEAARLIRMKTGRRMVTGTGTGEVKSVLNDCGIQMTTLPPPEGFKFGRSKGITLAHWLRLTHGQRKDRIFLVVAGWHWQLISGNRYVCGRIFSEGIVSINHPKVKRRARVAEVFELTSDNVKMPDTDVSKPKDPNAAIRAKAHRISKKIGADIEVYRSMGYTDMTVYPPSSISDDDDPFTGDHACFGWEEVVEMLETYQEMVA